MFGDLPVFQFTGSIVDTDGIGIDLLKNHVIIKNVVFIHRSTSLILLLFIPLQLYWDIWKIAIGKR
jgi:hypothetical protein